MSYVVHIWGRPLPTSLQEADAIQTQLSAKTGPEPAELTLLRTRLGRALAENPVYVGMGFDGLEDDLPTGPLLSLGIPSCFITELQPLLISESLALGLTVYDDQAGICYHPLQRAFTHHGSQPIQPEELQPHPLRPAGVWLDAKPQPETLGPSDEARGWMAKRRRLPSFQEALLAKGPIGNEAVDPIWLQARVLRLLGPWFIAQGFVERSVESNCTEFARLTEGGIQAWSLSGFLLATTPTGRGPGFCIRSWLQPWLPEPLQRDAGSSFPLVAPPHEALAWARPHHSDEVKVLVHERATLERVLADYLHSLATILLPLLEACRTPQSILALARREGPQNPLVPAAALLKLAHWEGADDHGALMLSLQKRMKAFGNHPANFLWPACNLRALPQAYGTLRPKVL